QDERFLQGVHDAADGDGDFYGAHDRPLSSGMVNPRPLNSSARKREPGRERAMLGLASLETWG
ncbi:hypothetical protein, partial [Nocardia asiatica]|uniref:hypothetical protein n=1 Tax=Nocardia asiatica TaxID=209252 RepID=UPI002453940C